MLKLILDQLANHAYNSMHGSLPWNEIRCQKMEIVNLDTLKIVYKSTWRLALKS